MANCKIKTVNTRIRERERERKLVYFRNNRIGKEWKKRKKKTNKIIIIILKPNEMFEMETIFKLEIPLDNLFIWKLFEHLGDRNTYECNLI